MIGEGGATEVENPEKISQRMIFPAAGGADHGDPPPSGIPAEGNRLFQIIGVLFVDLDEAATFSNLPRVADAVHIADDGTREGAEPAHIGVYRPVACDHSAGSFKQFPGFCALPGKISRRENDRIERHGFMAGAAYQNGVNTTP